MRYDERIFQRLNCEAGCAFQSLQYPVQPIIEKAKHDVVTGRVVTSETPKKKAASR